MVQDAQFTHCGMIIQSQIPTKFTPTQLESNMKIINIKNRVSRAPCSFQAGVLLSQHKQCSKVDQFCVFKKILLQHVFYRRPNKP